VTSSSDQSQAWIEAHLALTEQLVDLVSRRLLDPVEVLLDSVEGLRSVLCNRAIGWATDLLGADDQIAAQTAARLVSVLYTGDGPFDPPAGWWRTPLGQVVARRVGHPATEAVSYSVAGAMLGITRQGVHDLIRRNKLERHPDGGVTTRSVRTRLNRSGALGAHSKRSTPPRR